MEMLAAALGQCRPADALLLVSACAAFLSGALLVRAAAPLALRRRSATVGSVGEKMPRWGADLFAKGVGPLLPLARAMLRRRKVNQVIGEAAGIVHDRGLTCSKEGLASSAMACLALLLFFVWALTGSVFCSVAVGFAAAVSTYCLVRNRRAKRLDRMQDDIPEALKSLSDCLQAGLSLQQGFRRVAEDIKGPVGALFMRAAHRLESGCPASQALEVFREEGGSSELAFVSVVLDVQHLTGGSVGALIDTARESVQERIGLSRDLRVKTAQARLSAQVVSAMPFVLMALLSLMSEGFLDPFFESPAGWALFALALSMQLAGVVSVRRMLNVEGVG